MKSEMAKYLDSKLSELGARRAEPKNLRRALRLAGVEDPRPDFIEFFEMFKGPIGSDFIGYQLLDALEDHPSVLSATTELRGSLSIPSNLLAISDVLAGAALFYDCHSGRVFDVDFEGGVEMLDAGTLAPRWHSFVEFLAEFFGYSADVSGSET
jgi:hypothetical protein